MHPMLVMVEVQTPSFTFRGIGLTEAEARDMLAAAWKKHAEQTHCDPSYLDARGDGNVYELKAGQGWRDDRVVAETHIYGDKAYSSDSERRKADRDEARARNGRRR